MSDHLLDDTLDPEDSNDRCGTCRKAVRPFSPQAGEPLYPGQERKLEWRHYDQQADADHKAWVPAPSTGRR